MPMHTLKIDNFGKIESGEVHVGDFTVFAGPNNTGKSFVSKLLYSVFRAQNVDLTHERLARLASSFRREAMQLRHGSPAIDHRLRHLAGEVTKITSSYSRNDEPLDHVIAQLVGTLDEAKRWIEPIARRFGADTTGHPRRQTPLSTLQELQVSIDKLKTEIDDFNDPSAFALAELKYQTEQNLIQNFQVSGIEALKGVKGEAMQVDLDNALHITISESGIELVPEAGVPEAMGSASNLIYLESPVYWKLFRALQFIGAPSRMTSRYRSRYTLTGVPGYFYDLADSLTFEYSGEVAYPGVYEILTGRDVINGRISISDRGEMAFEEAGRSYPLHTASAGVANVGILAALIDRKVIDRGAMLFIDEPEAHLHPGWQVVIAEALFELAKGGVKVVIATHSVDILKWLEVRVKKNPDDARFIALNRFPNPAQNDDPLDVRIEQIKQDLTKPFLDLFLELR